MSCSIPTSRHGVVAGACCDYARLQQRGTMCGDHSTCWRGAVHVPSVALSLDWLVWLQLSQVRWHLLFVTGTQHICVVCMASRTLMPLDIGMPVVSACSQHSAARVVSTVHECRYVPVGLMEVVPQQMTWRPPSYVGRNDLETLMASSSAQDWVRISEMLLGPVPAGFVFVPKHKSNAYVDSRDEEVQG